MGILRERGVFGRPFLIWQRNKRMRISFGAPHSGGTLDEGGKTGS